MRYRVLALALAFLLGTDRAHATERAYVLNAGSRSVSIIDTATDTVTGTVDLPWSSIPQSAAAHPDGTRAYVAAGGYIFVIDPVTATVSSSFSVYFPTAVGVDPQGRRLYVASEAYLHVYDPTTYARSGYSTFVSWSGTQFLVVAPDGGRVYLLTRETDGVRFVDPRTRTVTATVAVASPKTAAVSPDGSTLYVASVSTLYAVDTASATIANQQPLASQGLVTVAPDGSALYVARSGALMAVDPSTLTVTTQSALSSDPSAIAMHPGGGRVYVADVGLDAVGVYDAGSLAPLGSIAVEDSPRGIAVGGCPGPAGDCDGDGATDASDNCPITSNPAQNDGDADGIGDACDNCPAAANAGQEDSDHNDTGDACQDVDGDGVIDTADNCVTTPNPGQENADGDLHGDACDVCPGADDAVDADSDRRADGCDNCPTVYNPGQEDGNSNGVGDACDDRDGDSVVDADDNCPDTPNPGQEDGDSDRRGDVCDPCFDTDHDGFGNPGVPGNACPDDNCPTLDNPDQTDSDGDSVGDRCAICSVMGDAASFGLVAADLVKWKPGAAYYNRDPMDIYIYSDICARKVIGRGGWVEYDIVATEPLKRAASILAKPGYYYVEVYANSVITGGGDAKVSPYAAEFVDTTGTHPEVQRCNDARAAAQAASVYFASLPPTRTIDEIVMRDDYYSQHLSLHVDGSEVINVQRLLINGRVGHWGCRRYSTLSIDQAAWDRNTTVVINVFDQLRIGDCAFIDNYAGDLEQVIINVVGTGKAVKFGQGSGSQVVVLAPDRAINVQGAHNFEEPTVVEPLYARKLKMLGYLVANHDEYDGWAGGGNYCGIDAEYAQPQP